MTMAEKKLLVARLIERGEFECARVCADDWGIGFEEAMGYED